MAIPHQHSPAELAEITARSQAARHVAAGFSAEMPALADFWRLLDTALADTMALSAEVARLNAELAAARLSAANLRAAARSALAACADGEHDPLWYLRDELNAPPVPARHRRGEP